MELTKDPNTVIGVLQITQRDLDSISQVTDFASKGFGNQALSAVIYVQAMLARVQPAADPAHAGENAKEAEIIPIADQHEGC